MNLLCWNCHGLGHHAIVREVRELMKIYAPTMLCLVETQLDKARAESLASFGFDKSYYAVASSWRSGDFVIFWNQSINLLILGYSRYHVDALVKEFGPESWRPACIYGEARVPKRYKTWDTLRSIAIYGSPLASDHRF